MTQQKKVQPCWRTIGKIASTAGNVFFWNRLSGFAAAVLHSTTIRHLVGANNRTLYAPADRYLSVWMPRQEKGGKENKKQQQRALYFSTDVRENLSAFHLYNTYPQSVSNIQILPPIVDSSKNCPNYVSGYLYFLLFLEECHDPNIMRYLTEWQDVRR